MMPTYNIEKLILKWMDNVRFGTVCQEVFESGRHVKVHVMVVGLDIFPGTVT